MPHSLLTNNQMDSSTASLRIVRTLGKLAACVAGLSLALPAPVFADLLDQRSELINKFVNEMHADPLVADCAAHGSFIASTSTAFDRVDFGNTDQFGLAVIADEAKGVVERSSRN
ncbi:BspC domain-containing protein, partial [Burkholderia multivorans]|uniref:BspC domain-containing protein n=1 Tax=Burkholderia multivorans TaxID=87883 RepID=UPI0035BE4B9E